MPALFQKKRFQMNAGGWSDFKLECDALGAEDYATLAFLASRKMQWGNVHGVPSGGVPMEEAFRPYCVAGHPTFLIVDDVLTTGGSLVRARERLEAEAPERTFKGLVVFARGPLPDWVRTFFTLDPDFWQND